MPDFTGRIQITGTIGAQVFTQSANLESVGHEGVAETVAVAKIGELTTRTDDDTGVVTFATGHGFTTGDEIDIFWTVGGVPGSRRAMTATVAGDAATLDGGAGDVLPALNTDVTGMVPAEYEFSMSGDDLILLGVRSNAQGWIVFADSSPADIAAATYRFDAAGGYAWADEMGTTNPLNEATVATVKFSHANSSTAQAMRAEALKIAG